jgi:hypothetical protein
MGRVGVGIVVVPATTAGATVALPLTVGVGIDVEPATTAGCGLAPPDGAGDETVVDPATTAGETVAALVTVGVGMLVEPATTDGAGFACEVIIEVGIDVDPPTTTGVTVASTTVAPRVRSPRVTCDHNHMGDRNPAGPRPGFFATGRDRGAAVTTGAEPPPSVNSTPIVL